MLDNRVLFVEIQTIDNGKAELKRLEGLAIKGQVSRKMGSVQSDAKIQIANLAKSDIEYLTTYTSPYYKPSTYKKINIYAGYKDTGWGRIFSGDIVKALPEGIPDTWLNIEAQSNFYNNRTPLSYGLTNATMQEHAKSIANNLGLAFDWQATTQKTISINFTGGKGHLIKEYNTLGDVTMFEDNGTLKVVDKITKPPENQNGMKVISAQSGMIGRPEPDDKGVKVRTLLDASKSIGDWFKLENLVLPTLNGVYQIYEMTFTFANRERDFYVDYAGKKAGIR